MPSKATAKAKQTPARKQPLTPASPPQWPPLQPLIPTENLNLDVSLEDQIVLIRNLFTPTLCKNYVSFLSRLPLITTPVTPKAGEAVRVNDRVQFDDPVFAQNLWSSTGLESLVTKSYDSESSRRLWGGEVLGLNPRIRMYRYTEGQFFGQHCRFTSYVFVSASVSISIRSARLLKS